MKKLILVFFLILIGQAAYAGPWTVGPQTPVYTNAHTLGDGSNLRGGEAPAYAYEAAEVPSNFTVSTWLHTAAPGGQFDPPGVGSEKKARFDCNVAFENKNDPIINPGVPNGASHDHTFFGNLAAATNTWNVSYASLRAAGNSTCYGGPLNRTLYWEPSVKKLLASGVVVTIKPKNISTYYEDGGISLDLGTASRWPRGLEMIEGFNMNDPTDTRITNIITALNAAAGFAKYSSVGASSAGGFIGWSCSNPISGNGSIATSPVPGAALQPWLRNADDTPTLNCGAGEIRANLESNPCWDGVNLTSPDGRSHMIRLIRDNGASKNVCPDGWYHVMRFKAIVAFNTTGQADYTNWYLSSDRMPGMTQFNNGQSMHFDLIPAWDYGTAASPGIFLRFSVSCDGTTISMGGTTIVGDPHECGYARIDAAAQAYVNEASPDGSLPNPVVSLNPDQVGTNRYFPVLPGSSGEGHLHHGIPCTQALPCQSMNDNLPMPANDNRTHLAGAAPVTFDLRAFGR